VSDLGELNHFLGQKISRNREDRIVHISQQKIIQVDPNKSLFDDSSDKEDNDNNKNNNKTSGAVK